MRSIRDIYETIGVDEYYATTSSYINPHQHEIETLIKTNIHHIPNKKILDLACGYGIITSTLQTLGYSNINGIDPYLYAGYIYRTGCKCFNISFKDIVLNGIPESFDCIICSFALHLCPTSMLPTLLWQIFNSSNKLIIISPSKFPLIGKPKVENFTSSTSNKRIHFRMYTK